MIGVFCSTPLRCGFGFESWSRGANDESSHGRGDCVVQGYRPEVDRTQAQGVPGPGDLVDYLDGSIWKAERVFGWSHDTVALGLNELRTGITCQGNFSARGNHKTETKSPELEADIRALADPESQADPKFQSPFLYTRITAKGMRQALIDQKGWTDEELPHVNTIGVILNRLGYKLRRVQKSKPLKKIPETDAIFENVRQENQTADDSPDVVRISMDAKAKV